MRVARASGWLPLVLAVAWPPAVHADAYGCFTRKGDPACENPLNESETCRLGKDFEIHTTKRDSLATVLAIHAGRIELDTGMIGAALAERLGWDFYEFQGNGGNDCLAGMNNSAVLHITSASFNEPTLLSMLSNDRRTISIHGYNGSASDDPDVEVVCAGGRDDTLIAAFAGSVARKSHMSPEFTLVIDHGPEFSCPVCRRLNGDGENNIVNRNSRGAGMQLEMSRRLREALVESGPSGDSLRESFYGCIREALIPVDRGDREMIAQGGNNLRSDIARWRNRLREGFSRVVSRLKERINHR